MSTYFAQVANGVVTDVRVVTSEYMSANPDLYTGTWIETFFDTAGKTYAGVGFTWDGTDFVPPIYVAPIVEEQ
jgi:hypothetical protein